MEAFIDLNQENFNSHNLAIQTTELFKKIIEAKNFESVQKVINYFNMIKTEAKKK